MGIINWPKYNKYPSDKNFFGIYYKEKWDCDGFWRTPSISDGFFDTYEEAKEYLEKYYKGGEIQYHHNDFYGWNYHYKYEIYCINKKHGFTGEFYNVKKYIKDLQDDGRWDKLDDGIKKLLISQTFNCDTLF